MAADLSFFRSETSQRLRAEGRAEGEAKGEAKSVLRILDRRGIATTQEVIDRITACADPDTLLSWLDRALTATTADDLFTED